MTKGSKIYGRGLRFETTMCECGYCIRGSPRNIQKMTDMHMKFHHPTENKVVLEHVIQDVVGTNNNNMKLLENTSNNNDIVEIWRKKLLN
jgi:hypothetical protein